MKRKIVNVFQGFWNWMRKTLADKKGDFPFGGHNLKSRHDAVAIDREIVVDDTRIHIKSIFTGQTRLEEAMKKIIIRKLTESKKPQH